ncbi:MAG: branched-chain amino acid ABC transporter substrate-binding protein [Gemmatimonadaceae bacterium]
MSQPPFTPTTVSSNCHLLASRAANRLKVAGFLLFSGFFTSACSGASAADAHPEGPHGGFDGKNGLFAIGVGATPGKPGYEGVTRGIQLAVERLNADAAGKFTFVLRAPDAATSTSVVQIAQQLRDDPSVIGVVGHPESGSSLEAIPVYADAQHAEEQGVVAVSPTASSPRLSGASRWFFRVAPSDDEAARLVARYVADSLGMQSAAVIYRNDSYGRDWSAKFSDTFIAKKHSVVARIPYLTGITEWNAYALELQKLAPQVLLFPGDADDATAMLRALKANNVKLTFLGGDGTEGIAKTHEFPDAKYIAFFTPEKATSTEGKRFVDTYRSRFHEEPDMFSALSYDAALAIGQSVLQGAHSRVAVRDALEHLTANTALDGAGGKIAFNNLHDVTGRTIVIATVGGGSK